MKIRLALLALFAVAILGATCRLAAQPVLGNGAAKFNGTTDAVVIVTNYTGFPSTNVTVEFWARSTNTTQAGSIFSFATPGNANTFLIYNHQNIQLWINNTPSAFTGVSINDGQWHHVAVTWSTSGQLLLYKDGALAFSGTNAAGSQLGSGGILVLGQDQDTFGGGFDVAQAYQGELDEVRVWSVVRNASEIAQSYTNALTGTESGLVSYYRFNEGIGALTADLTSLHQNATFRSGISWSSLVPYNAGSAIDLASGFVEVPSHSQFGSMPFTFTTWMRTSTTQNQAVVAMALGAGFNGWLLQLQGGRLEAYFLTTFGAVLFTTGAQTDGGLVNDGQWHHVAFSVDNGGGSLYIDGILKSSTLWQGTPSSAVVTAPLWLAYNGGGYGFDGKVDELAIWHIGMTPDVVQSTMMRRLNGNDPGITALYHFDEGEGVSITDSSPNHFDGSISNNVLWLTSGARISGLSQIAGRITSLGNGLPNILVSGVLPAISAALPTAIPDNNTVTLTHDVALGGTIGALNVGVNITHPYRGDLELTLIHPDGTEVRLKNADGTDAEPNLITTFPDTSTPVQSLSALKGKPITGLWKLRVRDAYVEDVGTLNTWTLQFGTVTVQSDVNGYYTLSNLYAGRYTVAPVREGFVFNPTNRLVMPDPTNADFALVSGFIAGRVLDNLNAGIPGVQITAGGYSATTDAQGYYRINGLPPSLYAVGASRQGFLFNGLLFIELGASNANFNAFAYPVGGRVIDTQSNGVAGVVVDSLGAFGSAVTDSQGYYLLSVQAGPRTITPGKAGVVFSPASRDVVVGQAIANANFVAVQSPPSISQISNQVVAKNGSTGPLRFSVNDSETRPALLQVVASSSNTNLVPAQNLVIEGVGNQRTLTVTPATDHAGSNVITVTVTDESGLSASMSFGLRVNQLPLPGVGRALTFNGINQVAVGATNVALGKGNFTVEAWAMAPSNSGPRTLISQGAEFTLGINAAGQIQCGTNWDTGVPFPFGGWHHLALARDTFETRLYIDGQLSATLGSALPSPSTVSPLLVGAVAGSGFWLGAIDEVRVWRVARSAGDIATNRAVRLSGGESSLVGLWHFDEENSYPLGIDSTMYGRNLAWNGTRIQSPILFDPYVTPVGKEIHDSLVAYDGDGDPLTFTIVSSPSHGTVTLLSSNSGAFVYTADLVGDDQFTFSVNDGYSDSQAYPVNFRISADTNLPVISFIPDYTILEDTTLGPVPFTVIDAERVAERLPVFGVSSNQALVPDQNISIGGNGTNRTIFIRPATNQFGDVLITLITSDGTQQSTTSFRLTVTPVNDPPTIKAMTNLVVPRGALVYQPLVVGDVDTLVDTLAYSAGSSNSALVSATVTFCSGVPCLQITSSGNQSGTTTITVTASDASSSGSANLQVTVNDPPVISTITNQTTFRNLATVPIPITLSDVDNAVANVTLTATSANQTVVENTGFTFSGSGSNRFLVITPADNRIGSTVITVTASDGLSQSSKTFTLFVEEGPIFELIKLPALAADEVTVPTGMNDAGQVVGLSAKQYTYRSVIWRYADGQQPTASLIPGLENGNSWARAINNSGDIVGTAYSPNYAASGYLYRGGVLSTPFNAQFSRAVDISDSGTILWLSNYFAPGISSEMLVGSSGSTSTGLGDPFLYGGVDWYYPPTAVLDPFGNASTDEQTGNLVIWENKGTNGFTANLVTKIGLDTLPRGMNAAGDVVGMYYGMGPNGLFNWLPFVYNWRTGQTRSNIVFDLMALGFASSGQFLADINEAGEMVGEALPSSGVDGVLYTDGRWFKLRDLFPRDYAYTGCRAFAINAAGDIAGYTYLGSDYPGGQTFVLRRKRWTVGQPVAPPLQAVNPANQRVFRQPTFQATDGTPDAQVAQAALWSDLEQRFYFLRPIQGKLSWYTSADLLATNAVVIRRGVAVWPDRPQIHVAGAPVDLGPVDPSSSPYRPVAVPYSTMIGVTFDASTRAFQAPNPGYSVVRYMIAPEVPFGSIPDQFTHTNYFEVVHTVAYNDPSVFRDLQPAMVGTKVSDPRGPAVSTNSFKSGWTIFPIAPYDGAGADRAYDRTTQTGPIIPVNQDGALETDNLVVAFYKKHSLTGVLWPDLPVHFVISWPTNAEPLVIANSLGSGPLPEGQYPDKRIYNQPNRNLPGFNPNEEHAFLAPSASGQGVFALRNDLNRSDTSTNLVLLKYRNPTNNEWQFKTYRPVLMDADHAFNFSGEAGKEILPPYPLSLLPICPGTTNILGLAFRDHRQKFYALTGPTPADPNPQIVMRYFYPMQPDFYYDRDGDGTNDVPVGTCLRWDGIPPGSQSSRPIDVTYRIRWPADAPALEIGETLLDSKHDLPGITDWASAQVVFDSLNPTGNKPLTNAARLYDPLSARVLKLTNVVSASYKFPTEINLQTSTSGKQTFTDLPFYLRSRLSYDPVNKALSFAGFLDDTVLGEPLLLINVLSEKEKIRIKRLSGDPDFSRIVDALYDLTRNPNRVNVSRPGQLPPDADLLIGFTTRYIVQTTNSAGAIITTNFFGSVPTTAGLTFLSTNIALEPLGGGVKALTAGLPVPSSRLTFGRALKLDGLDDRGSTTIPIEAPQEFTLEFWFQTTSTTGGVLLGFGDNYLTPSGAQDRQIVLTAQGRIQFYVFDTTGHVITSPAPASYNDGNWHHVAASLSAGTGMRLYMDGVQVAGNPAVVSGYHYSGYWKLGSDNGIYEPITVDDVRIWNVARPLVEIQQDRNRPLTGSEDDLAIYWNFEEPSGTNALDGAQAFRDLALWGNPARISSTVPASGSETRWMVLAENNDPALGALPVTLHVIKVEGGPFTGDLKTILPDNVFDERLTIRHSADFGAAPDKLDFEWWYHPDDADFDPTRLPIVNPDGSIADTRGWFVYSPALVPNQRGQNTITLGDGGETSQFTLADNWFISRYRGYDVDGKTNWSDWIGDPSSSTTPRASFAPGWVKRVVEGIGPFEARTKDFHDNPASTFASMLIQAGQRYEGDIALNPSGQNLLNIGLIEAYTTVLNRGKNLSIDGLPPVDSDPLNNALLLAASRISDLYMLLGNEAFADAQDPTIGFFSDDLSFGTLATATFAFKNQLDSLLAEELALLRGRDDSSAGVGARPVYNRLLWNFTGSDGEVAYERTYNVGDLNLDGVINEFDAKILFPQGHGDAWGHYLTAITTYYDLLRHPRFTWIPRTETVLIAGTAVRVDFLDERKFANVAAAKAKAGTEIVDLTYRARFVDDPEGQYQGYKDTKADRAWGVTEWARRAGQGAYFDWVVGNAILPSTDPNPNHTGLQKIDRQTVQELDQIISEHGTIQAHLDKSDAGLNPLGLVKGAVPFDIDPSLLVPTAGVQSVSHFEQIYDRAVRAMNNCVTVWNLANDLSETLRRQQDEVDEFTANVADQERDFKNRLIEVFGYPYAGDIGPGKTYPSGYDGPDIYHYMYVNATDLTGGSRKPAGIMNGFFASFADGTNAPNAYFNDDLAAGSFTTTGAVLQVQFPLAQGDWAFVAPPTFGSRRAPGELQAALSDLLQEETRLKIALGNHDALLKNIQDAATLLQSRLGLSNQVITLLTSNKTEQVRLNTEIQAAQTAQLTLRRISDIVTRAGDLVVNGVPKDASDALFFLDEIVRAMVGVATLVGSEALEVAADVSEGVQNQYEKEKERTQLQTDLDVEVASQDYEIKQQAAELIAMMRDESTLRLEAFNQAELVKQSLGRYQAALAAGQRLVEERTVFRQRTASDTQQNRYKDMAFRVFRNEALQKYRAQFDLASRYVYLAATAYDYELNFLGSNNRAGRDFFTDIVRQRSIGQLLDGIPIAGSSGLSDALGRLKQNFEVLRPRFGLNNPQTETTRLSLRTELFRIRDDSDDQWRRALREAVVPNLWDVPEFRRYCRPFAPESAGAQPGIVIHFSSTITFGLNFFGFPLGGADNAYDASLFSTKLNAVGVWFSNYNSAGLATAPRVYLVPAGMDVMRSPTGNSLATREWKVLDQVIPVPFPIGSSDLTDPSWIPINDSLSESFAQIRRFSSFRAYHDAGVYDDTQTTKDSRLIGRSVWNTDWVLIIPGGTFLSDPEQGLETFINSISDIRISLQSYSYSGD